NARDNQNADIEYEREHADDPDLNFGFQPRPEQIEARQNATRLDTEADSAGLLILEHLDTYETVDKLLMAAELRRDRILRELDFRRERIAPLLRKTSDELIDARADAVPVATEQTSTMTSHSKIAANQRNSRRSSGPRTVAGKLPVSRSALRHGLAAATLRDSGIAAEVDRLATAIAGENADAVQREQALIIAESELSLLRVRAVRTNILEQMRATATEEGGSRGDQANAVLPGVIGGAYLDQLRRLERYERRAFSKRQGAIRKLLDFQRTIGSYIDKINYF